MIKIRKARNEDFNEILSLLTQLQNVHAVNRPDIFVLGQAVMEQAEFETMLKDEKTFEFVAELNGKVVGMIVLMIKTIDLSIMEPRTVGYIDDFVVDDSVRHCGIGQMLFNKAKETAFEKQCHTLELNAWNFNDNALKFYEKNGMKIQRVIYEYKL